MDSLVQLQKKIVNAGIKFNLPENIIEQLKISHELLLKHKEQQEEKKDHTNCDICCQYAVRGQKQCLNNCRLDICQLCQSRVNRCPYCRCEYGSIMQDKDELQLLQIDDIETVRQRYHEIYRNVSGDPNKYQHRYKSTNEEIQPVLHYNYEESKIQDGLHMCGKLKLHEKNDPKLEIIDARRLLINVKQSGQIVRNILVDYRDIDSLQCMNYNEVNDVLFKNISNLYKEFTKESNIKFVNKFGKREISLYNTKEFVAIWYLSQPDNKYMLMFKKKVQQQI